MTFLMLMFPRISKIIFLSVFCAITSLVSAQEKELIYNDTAYIYRSIEEASKNPEKVFRLNLSRNKLSFFPPEILNFSNLIELDLSRNMIEEIPEGIGRLINLRKLNVANNNIVHLPDSIGMLTSLVYFGLNRNELEDLPPSIGNLQKLEVFELWDNELKDVPDEISELGNLRILEMRGILFTDEEAHRIDSLVVKSAKIYLSPSCNCKN